MYVLCIFSLLFPLHSDRSCVYYRLRPYEVIDVYKRQILNRYIPPSHAYWVAFSKYWARTHIHNILKTNSLNILKSFFKLQYSKQIKKLLEEELERVGVIFSKPNSCLLYTSV